MRPEQDCPVCGHPLDDETPIEKGTIPKSGDFAVCFYCGALLVYRSAGRGYRLRLFKITKAEEERIDDSLRGTLDQIQAGIRALNR